MANDQYLQVAIAQISPVWLNRDKTIDKILAAISEAANKGAELVTFGETLLPGYPFWIELTNGAEFNSTRQKEIHAHYLRQAVNIEEGHLQPICDLAKQRSIAVIVGVAERATDRGGHSVYCSLVYIDKDGLIQNVHRKLMPTYEERLTWASGDGHGLRTFPVGPFTMGALNCWENWMPLARAALYGQGENLHVAIWPGGEHNTHDITRFIAKESRSYVISASGLMRAEDFPADTPYLEEILEHAKPMLANGASCIAGPDGEWLVEPQIGKEGIYLATLDFNTVLEERHSFDPVGHYSRPDVTQLHINRERQSTIKIKD
ncbi:carbon-nitrogen hydrolase family protein [Marinomonas colpomeniae]|uniref:Carbon-nitrogen hydrolase family protein n=1 Tax=Marinomonas colpomeniae TaxID=2774408 RepID=A0ABR8NXH0_9GAMM|nr:carbon-nitrogen hydrolase family protein [Marinomonas colpomeniae]MBD5770744.1 carbon-nitrogen hydrolase family protein [Marinomonas colpomeniae]